LEVQGLGAKSQGLGLISVLEAKVSDLVSDWRVLGASPHQARQYTAQLIWALIFWTSSLTHSDMSEHAHELAHAGVTTDLTDTNSKTDRQTDRQTNRHKISMDDNDKHIFIMIYVTLCSSSFCGIIK